MQMFNAFLEYEWMKCCRSMRLLNAIFALLIISTTVQATETDSLHHYNYSLHVMPGKILALDKYAAKWIRETNNLSIAAEIGRVALPTDSDAYASDFGYPSLTLGVRYMLNHQVRLRRSPDTAWGMAEMVDYDSHLGNTLSLYGKFYRPFARHQHWETAYSLSFGIGYSHTKYNKQNNIDNELIGTNALIYFGAGVHATYHLNEQWGIRGGLEFVHHSNGALYRPNKGSNSFGTSIGVVYEPYYNLLVHRTKAYSPQPFERYWYLNLSAGMGAKTMLEDWLTTQFRTPSSHPDYRTEHFKVYAAYSVQADVMCRYARRWASGIGIDWFYGTYASHIADLDAQQGNIAKHSPWSLGIAAKHEVFYHQLSLGMSFGWYLHRQMGYNALFNESRFYERIGLHYTFSSAGGLKLGINIKAHETKADLTELVIAYPFRL